MECRSCGKQVVLPFRCPRCGGYFCSEHRLPENHQCPRMKQLRVPMKETETVVLQKQEPYEYRIAYTPPEPKKRIQFSDREIRHLAIAALLVVGIGLSWSMFDGFHFDFSTIYIMLVITTILLTSFLTHEISHKIVAQLYGLWAEFRIVFTGVLLTLISIFLPFKVISPGAVMVSGFVDKEKNGKISIAGPLTNIILSIVFLLLTFLFYSQLFVIGFMINSWIAFFNLLPFGMLDGFKVLLWNKMVWGLAFTASLILTIAGYFL